MSFQPAPLDRRRLLLGAAAFAAPALAAPAAKAEVCFQVDDSRLRALFARRLREGCARALGDGFFADITTDSAGARLKLRRAEDFSALAAALPRIGDGLGLGDFKNNVVRVDWSAAALDAQAQIWRDRAKKMLEAALGARKPAFVDKDARNFTLTVEGMDRAQWFSWIGARIDLFFPTPFALAPVAPAPGAATFSPRPFPRGRVNATVVVETGKTIGNEDDIFVARADGDKLVLQLTRPGADIFATKNLPAADKTAYALMFDRALAALCVLDGAARENVLRLRIERGLGAAELAELIFLGGSAPQVKQVDARFT